MARKTPSRLQKRREAEAAEALEQDKPKKTRKTAVKKKKAKRKSTRKKKAKASERKRIVWGIFSSSLKEEARFPYDQKKEAEAKLKALLDKGKRTYFMQPIKEVITDKPSSDEEE